MDINGFNGIGAPYDGVPFSGLPLGLGMGLIGNEAAMDSYAGLTEAKKEELILRCKAASTKEEMQEIVDSLAPGTDVQGIYEEEKESFS